VVRRTYLRPGCVMLGLEWELAVPLASELVDSPVILPGSASLRASSTEDMESYQPALELEVVCGVVIVWVRSKIEHVIEHKDIVVLQVRKNGVLEL